VDGTSARDLRGQADMGDETRSSPASSAAHSTNDARALPGLDGRVPSGKEGRQNAWPACGRRLALWPARHVERVRHGAQLTGLVPRPQP